jgi:LAGLIDADG endonuclease
MVAVGDSNIVYYYSAIFWNILARMSTRNVSEPAVATRPMVSLDGRDRAATWVGAAVVVPFAVKIFSSVEQSVGNQEHSFEGSSETTRPISYDESNQFNFWLAGIIDGDGYLGVTSSGGLTCEITLHEKDVKTLYFIKRILGYGHVTKRSGVKAYRFRTSKLCHVIDIIKKVNGKLLTHGKQNQLRKLCNVAQLRGVEIKPILPTFLCGVKA